MYNYSQKAGKTSKIKITYAMARFKCVNFYICNDA